MSDQVPAPVKRERNRILRELAAQKGATFRRSLVGRTLCVVTLEEPSACGSVGLSDNYVKVLIPEELIPPNQIVEIRASGVQGEFVIGECIPSQPLV